jgi:hypothetical protein
MGQKEQARKKKRKREQPARRELGSPNNKWVVVVGKDTL